MIANNTTNKKTLFYAFGTVALILIGSFFMLESGNAEISGNAVLAEADGDLNGKDAQNIVISMKNYNYYPNTIKVKAGKPVSISLDGSVYGCFRSLTIRELGVSKYLRTPEDKVEFTPVKKGTYTFACSMGMGTGKLVVE